MKDVSPVERCVDDSTSASPVLHCRTGRVCTYTNLTTFQIIIVSDSFVCPFRVDAMVFALLRAKASKLAFAQFDSRCK